MLAVVAAALILAPQTDRSAEGVNLVRNGTFDEDVDGWSTNTSTTELGLSTLAHSGSHAASLSTIRSGSDVILDDSPNTVPSALAGTTYEVSGWVRTDAPPLSGQLRVREVSPERQVTPFAKSFSLTSDTWTRVTFSFSTVAVGSSLDLSVLGWKLMGAQRLYVDDLSLRRVAAPDPQPNRSRGPSTSPTRAPVPASPAPMTTPTPTPTPLPSAARPSGPSIATLSNGVGISSRGLPASGALVGAAVGGNTDPTAFERKLGQRLGVRRTYWGPGDVDRAVLTARGDLAEGRLPWISFKLPYSWAQMADGAGDAWTLGLATRLSELPGPVWVAFHHEPETDGDINQWTRMQERLGPILRSNAPNAAFTVILTGYHQLQGDPRYSLDEIWPRTTVDVVGFDIYNFYGTRSSSGREVTTPSDLDQTYFKPLGRWAASKGVAWGLAETGLNDAAAERYPDLMQETYQAMVDEGGIAFTYFNSRLNSTSSWSITTEVKLREFASVVRAAPTFPKFV